MKRLSHREACYELRRSAKLLERGTITRDAWFASVDRIFTARFPGGLYPPAAPRDARA